MRRTGQAESSSSSLDVRNEPNRTRACARNPACAESRARGVPSPRGLFVRRESSYSLRAVRMPSDSRAAVSVEK
jgi:hypothetical protein